MSKSNDRKTAALGMSVGTAAGRLRKSILFSLVIRLEENFCYQCGGEILTESDLSIEHKEPWLHADDPVKSFFDLDNISFSHLSCNCAARKSVAKTKEHGTITMYIDQGCRCSYCVEAKSKYSLAKYKPKVRREKYLRTGK